MTGSHSIHAAMWLCSIHKSFFSLNRTSPTTYSVCCIILSIRNCFFGLSKHLKGTQSVTHSLTLRQHICPIIAQFYFWFLKVKFVNIFERAANGLLRLWVRLDNYKFCFLLRTYFLVRVWGCVFRTDLCWARR
jgi:hypothetical protein